MAIGAGSGVLSEHEAPKPDEAKGSDQPSDEEVKLSKQVDRLFEKYAKHRKRYDRYWVDNYKMFRGEQWLKRRPSYKNKEVINMIFETIQSQVSTMMDVRPTVGFLPQDPSDLELSQILGEVFECDWEKGNWSDEITAVSYDSHIYSIGASYLGYDPDLYHGMGGIEFCCDDPLNVYPDPDATDVNKKAEGYICAKPEDVDKLKKRYSGHKFVELIKPDLEDLSYSQRNMQSLYKRKNTDLDLPVESTQGMSSTQDEFKDKALVVTAYLRPSDTEEIEQEDLDGEKLYITKLKYPKGRKVVKINNYIFEDGPLPYDHMEFPYQRLVNYVLPREFFGISEVDNTKGPQQTFNKLVNFALDTLQLMGNPIWKVPVAANVNTRKLINQPGLIIEYSGDQEPKREEGVALQPYVLQLIDRMEKYFNDVAGTQDVTRGVNPTGVTANSAIENLLEQAQKRVKQKMRNLDSYLKSFGRQWLSLCFQFYTAPRIIRLTNNQGATKYFRFHIENRPMQNDDGSPLMGIDGEPKTKKYAVVVNYDQNTQQPMNQVNEYEIRGEFDVKVNTISGLAFSKAENKADLMDLFDRQIIDGEEVLKRLDYPNAEQVLIRMKQAAQEQASMAAQSKQGA